MEPFDKNRGCPKCGYGDVGSHYQAEVADLPHPAISSRLMIKEEHIERCCQECSFKWPEACCGVKWLTGEISTAKIVEGLNQLLAMDQEAVLAK